MPMRDHLREIARNAFEAARKEVVRRLAEHDLPTSVADDRMLAIDNDALTGWQSEREIVRRSRWSVRRC